MDTLYFAQNNVHTRISKAFSNFKKAPKERITKEYVSTRIEQLESYWTHFCRNDEEITKLTDSKNVEDSKYHSEDMYSSTEELYLDYKCCLKTKLALFSNENIQAPQVQTSAQPDSNLKLPKIEIPKFSGLYNEWTTFRDLFTSLIHNANIDNIQKMQYLKGLLTGEAEQLVRHISIASNNYDRCWAIIEERYNNKRFLSHCIMKRLFDHRNVAVDSASDLKYLVANSTECLGALSNLGIDVSTWDIIIIHMLSLRLDPETRKQWELQATNTKCADLPRFEHFKEFIINRYRALEIVDTGSKLNKWQATQRTKSFIVTSDVCKMCNENHRIIYCKRFLNADISTRRNFAENNSLCINCLGVNHAVQNCRNTRSCRICQGRHHSLLHAIDSRSKLSPIEKSVEVSPTEANVGVSKSPDSAPVVCFASGKISTSRQVLLPTALVQAEIKNGERRVIRALLDQGSQASFITEATAQYLGLKKTPVQGLISGLGEDKNVYSKSMVKLCLTSLRNSSMKFTVSAYVLKSITTLLPSRKLVIADWIDDLDLADPQYNTPNKIDVLLGAEVYGKILQEGIRKDVHGSLVAQNTSLGWILSGSINNSNHTTNVVALHICEEETNLLKQFWELEADPNQIKKHILTEEEKQCEEFFANTTTRDKDGRYVVRLPLKTGGSQPQVACSKKIAEKRLNVLNTKLNKSQDLKTQYTEVLNEYLQLQHMEEIPKTEINNVKAIYLSHFAVIRYDKDTTKVRIVFDASCKGENGISLNDFLMVGPTLQPDLRHLLMKWRLHRICLSADIEKMYRQVKVADQDTDLQRILWKEDHIDDIKEYRLSRVTFGTACAPYLAVKALQQVATDEGKIYPYAADKIATSFYMDDLLTGCDTIEEGQHIYKEMNELLGKAGFKLQKWSSNSEKLLTLLQTTQKGHIEDNLKLKIDEIMKLLGLTWNRTLDAFQYTVNLPPLQKFVTKRAIISDISRLFDPLGWVAPTVVIAKIIIQKLWISGISWDEEVSNSLLNEWLAYRQELTQLQTIQVPRWIGTLSNNTVIELHGFADASKVAYAAVVYIRVVDSSGKGIQVSLFTAKTKVAPIKQVSIPRLELCGAVLVTRLLKEVADILNVPKHQIHAWTDSTVVLAWLNSHPNKWQTFVANRVSEIITSLDAQHWSHVKSQQNPADCASRGLKPTELVKNDLWLQGPEFLHKQEIPYNKLKDQETNLEVAKVHVVTHEQNFWNKFSSFNKLIRVVAYCRRVLTWTKEYKTLGFLTTAELKTALEICIRKCQEEHFAEEIASLKKNPMTKLKGPLKSLNPFLDSNQILRVGGRLEKSQLKEDRKHPIILPKAAALTKLIIADAHFKTFHGGPALMLRYLQSNYWILGAKILTKALTRNCIKCVRYSATTKNQLMGQLPSVRVTPSRPFKHSGVDYAGPINIRTSKGRGQHSHKGYICLFVCMVTKAVHIEVVSDLTTQGFLAAFKRFVSRRGYCSDVWSDNGTNFQGAAKELELLFSTEKSNMFTDIAESLAQNGTNWHFIPPHAPNFGGLWEAGVKSVKRHLSRVIGDSTLTYEELSTVLIQIEACLNSRPLSRIDNESEGFDALTPGHFLVGEPLLTVPDYNFEVSNISSLRRWQLTQRMMQSFWRRWSRDYLTMFMNRYKWSHQISEPKVGDLVLVKEDNLPPSRWLLGRIITTHPGADKITRVVSLRTKGSIIKRPVSKLCTLPVSSSCV